MPIKLELPFWMVERIVAILSEHPYTIRLITAWLCNLLDTAATVHLFLNYEGEELNPISAWLLSKSPALFVAVKLAIMTGAVAFLWWKRDWLFCKVASWFLCIEYLAVALYYLYVYAILIPAFT